MSEATSPPSAGNTSKPGYKSTEFALAVVVLLGAVAGAATGQLPTSEAVDLVKWTFTAYCGVRGMSKFGANEVVGALVGAARNALAKPATLAQANTASQTLGSALAPRNDKETP